MHFTVSETNPEKRSTKWSTEKQTIRLEESIMGLTALSRIQGKAWRRWNCPDLRTLVEQVTLVTFLWKVHDQWWLISWIGATFTLLSLIICAFCDFFLSACLINWIGSFNSLKPDHFISSFPHENNLRVKKQFGNSVAIFKITRLLTL